MVDRIGGAAGAGYVPEDDMDVAAAGGAPPDPLAEELGSDRAELDGLGAAEPAALSSTGGDPSAERALADAFVRGGTAEVHAVLEGSPDLARSVLLEDRADLERGVREALARSYGGLFAGIRAAWNADALVDDVESSVTDLVRERVRSEATSVLDARISALDALDPEALASSLLAAPPGSAGAAIARVLGVDGSDIDGERLEGRIATARDELVAMRGVIAGGTWSPDELPGTRSRVMTAMGLADAPVGSIAHDAFGRDAVADLTPPAIELTADLAVAAYELHHFVEAGYALGIGVTGGMALAAIVVGAGIHHLVEENRTERRDAARALGL